MDTTSLRDAYRALLNAAATVAGSGDTHPVPPAGEWNADQILAHVSLVSAATITAAASVASGVNTTYDNRTALDTWTIERVIALAGGNAGLQDRIRRPRNNSWPYCRTAPGPKPQRDLPACGDGQPSKHLGIEPGHPSTHGRAPGADDRVRGTPGPPGVLDVVR